MSVCIKFCKCVFDILFGVDLCELLIVGLFDEEVVRVEVSLQCELLWFYVWVIVEGVDVYFEDLDVVICVYVDGWLFEWMLVFDCVIVCVGVWEILYNDEVFDVVVILEVVEQVVLFSIDDLLGFFNGFFGVIVCDQWLGSVFD